MLIKIAIWFFYPCIAFATILYWLLKCGKVIKLKFRFAALLSLCHEIGCAICASAMSFVEADFILENAVTFRLYGLMFFMPLFYYAVAKIMKIDKAVIFDVFALALIIRLVIGRTDCLIAGCCQGLPIFFMENIRWPIREIELCYYVVFMVLFAGKVSRGKTWGQVYPLYLLTYGSLRFVLEWVREEHVNQIGIFHLAHIWSLIAIVVGTGLYIKNVNKHKTGEVRRKKPGKHPEK